MIEVGQILYNIELKEFRVISVLEEYFKCNGQPHLFCSKTLRETKDGFQGKIFIRQLYPTLEAAKDAQELHNLEVKLLGVFSRIPKTGLSLEQLQKINQIIHEKRI